MENLSAVVIDNGSYMTKVGFSGEESPKVEVRTVVAQWKTEILGLDRPSCYVGEKAIEMNKKASNILNMSNPISHGNVSDWEALKLLERMIALIDLRIEPSEYNVFITEHPDATKACREKMAEILLESYPVEYKGLSFGMSPAMSLYASGNTSGVSIDSGDGCTWCVPVYEGVVLREGIRPIKVSGNDMTEYFNKLIAGKVAEYPDLADINLVREIKEKFVYLANDYEEELKKPEDQIEKQYELPDGRIVKIGKECFTCGEMVFHPQMAGIEENGIHQVINESINKCDIYTRTILYGNILLSGGTSMVFNNNTRFEMELKKLAPSQIIKRNHIDNTINASWIGASILTSLTSFQKMWVTREDYEEKGVAVFGNLTL
ncbi:actin, putative [Entamoeba invadens IP1]|uniref:Actin, putative n=1 Tax=Entamoeba invadens IP1 TaxID=370355 RepID=A0A0A1UCK3_ENTIV|nr:actin, putative [Entamoeba invadens IP1]ELP91383.1 actin, putative [Entamoeba invadens IP1]|eukprot:XP_004258154.1 actin, putative [Entamoeba invadens IP1]